MALIRKSAWERVGGYALFEVEGWEDYDLWCKFIEEGFEAVFARKFFADIECMGGRCFTWKQIRKRIEFRLADDLSSSMVPEIVVARNLILTHIPEGSSHK